MTPAEANALALDLYNRWPTFNRTFTFSTDREGWYIGAFRVVIWDDFALPNPGVGMNAIEIKIQDLQTADGVRMRWTVKMSNRTIYDGDASFFRELARKDRATPNADRIATS